MSPYHIAMIAIPIVIVLGTPLIAFEECDTTTGALIVSAIAIPTFLSLFYFWHVVGGVIAAILLIFYALTQAAW